MFATHTWKLLLRHVGVLGLEEVPTLRASVRAVSPSLSCPPLIDPPILLSSLFSSLCFLFSSHRHRLPTRHIASTFNHPSPSSIPPFLHIYVATISALSLFHSLWGTWLLTLGAQPYLQIEESEPATSPFNTVTKPSQSDSTVPYSSE